VKFVPKKGPPTTKWACQKMCFQ